MTSAMPSEGVVTEWIEVGAVTDFPRRGARIVRALAGEIAVFRTEADGFFVLGNRCPHRGGPLGEGIVSGTSVACPLHSMVIDLATGRAVAPDEGCVPVFAVRIENGRVLLGLAVEAPARAE
jgi:nitrite reductase (NADH) small subunit